MRKASCLVQLYAAKQSARSLTTLTSLQDITAIQHANIKKLMNPGDQEVAVTHNNLVRAISTMG